jgi:molybdopterin converting factor small subunit
MNIALKIKYYVPFDDLMGKTEVLHIEGGTKIIVILQLLAKRYKGFALPNIFDQVVILLNGKLCKEDWPIEDGDQVSIFTPLVGG